MKILRKETWGEKTVTIIRCTCGLEVPCYAFTNTCVCGSEYNWNGKLLPPRSHWDEKKERTWQEILNVSHERK